MKIKIIKCILKFLFSPLLHIWQEMYLVIPAIIFMLVQEHFIPHGPMWNVGLVFLLTLAVSIWLDYRKFKK